MIKELRLGNYVLDTFDRIALVESISTQGIRLTTKTYRFESFRYDQVKPISLTENILLKCGFEKKSWITKGALIECVYYQLGNFIVYLLQTSFEVELIVGNDKDQFNLFVNFKKELHILQNLFFSLCGKELDVNLQ
jgi:hypothetical protein